MIEHRLPAMFPFRGYAEAGGLMAYSADQNDLFRRAAVYVLLETMLGRDPGVDRASTWLHVRTSHAPSPAVLALALLSRRPKKRGPLQRVPVIT